ncbi:MAG: GC-type dockerin domain-anchored protein [Planctomycetota bacterium]
MGDLPGGSFASTALDVSTYGDVVVGWSRATGNLAEAFVWTSGTGMVGLGTLPDGGASEAHGVSGDGSIIVGAASSAAAGGFVPFRWTQAEGMQPLPGFADIVAVSVPGVTAVSEDGSTIVGAGVFPTDPLERDMFRWAEETGVERLGGPPGSYNRVANAVSADGAVIVGFGRNGDSDTEGWIARLVTCDADITTDGACQPGAGDGAVTLSDFSCYLSEWSQASAIADVTTTGACDFGAGGDGVDLSDFSCFLAAWASGCP